MGPNRAKEELEDLGIILKQAIGCLVDLSTLNAEPPVFRKAARQAVEEITRKSDALLARLER